MAVRRTHKTADVARALGLTEATVRKYARNGWIPFDVASSGHRLFDIEEVRTALQNRRVASVAPPVRSRRTRGWLTDALELEAWADRIEARSEFPEVVRALVAGSVPELLKAEFRAAEGSGMGGWDGLVVAASGNRWVPEGRSAWELGVSEDATSKADWDYAQRTKEPLGLVKSETVFVFVTPRRWPNRDSWVTAKRAEGHWKDVLAYDADSLEQWMEATPTAHTRITRMLGRDPDGAATVEEAWKVWAGRTDPAIPADLATADRATEVDQLVSWLNEEPTAISVWGDSTEESFAFIAACLLGVPEPDRTTLLSTALVVRTPSAWGEILSRADPGVSLLLIAVFPDAEWAQATDAGHRVVIPVGRGHLTAGPVISLPPLRARHVQAALEAAGVPSFRAHELAQVARRSLLTLRRVIREGGTAKPRWAQPENGGALVPLVLAGAWREGNKADEQILEALADRPYADINSVCARWAAEEDMPVRMEGSVWSCVSKKDAWGALSFMVTTRHLDRFGEAAIRALGPVDQAPTEEDALSWSPQLRASITETLAVIATRSSRVLPNGDTGQEFVDRIISRVLESANADRTGQLWTSLSSLLPALAEASPAEFIDAVEAGLDSSVLGAVLGAEPEGTLFGASPRPSMVRALEALAWAPEYLGSAVLALARLGGLRPSRQAECAVSSLRQIFLPAPQTAATGDERLGAIDLLRREVPDLAWSRMICLLPTPHAMYLRHRLSWRDSPPDSYRPRWREWRPDADPDDMSPAERESFVGTLVSRLLDDAGMHGQRWADLVASLAYVPKTQRNLILDQIDALDPSAFADTDRAEVVSAMHKIGRNAGSIGPRWIQYGDLVDRIAGQLSRFAPACAPAPDVAQLFTYGFGLDQHPGYGGILIHIGTEKLQAADRLRDAAVRDLIAADGPSVLLELARHCQAPNLLGEAVGRTATVPDDIMIGELDSSSRERSALAQGWVVGRFSTGQWQWATPHLQAARTWPVPRVAGFLLALPPDSQVFDWADQLGDEVRGRYWELVSLGSIEDDADRDRAVRTLVGLGRAARARTLLVRMIDEGRAIDPRVIAEALADSTPDPAPDGDAGLEYFHGVIKLLEYLSGQAHADRRHLAWLELRYLPFLDLVRRQANAVHQEMARDPEFFAEIIALFFPSDRSEDHEASGEESERVTRGRRLLQSWRTVPGTPGSPGAAGPDLAQWVTSARMHLARLGLARLGERYIGHILSQTPEDPDGTWPGQTVREIIEAIKSQEIEQGIDTAIYKDQTQALHQTDDWVPAQRDLAAKYRTYAKGVGPQWPRTRSMLRRMAENWDRHARQTESPAHGETP